MEKLRNFWMVSTTSNVSDGGGSNVFDQLMAVERMASLSDGEVAMLGSFIRGCEPSHLDENNLSLKKTFSRSFRGW
jgi:hypothetical protein